MFFYFLVDFKFRRRVRESLPIASEIRSDSESLDLDQMLEVLQVHADDDDDDDSPSSSAFDDDDDETMMRR